MSDLALTQAGRLDASGGNPAKRLERVSKALEQQFLQQLMQHALPAEGDDHMAAIEDGPGTRQAREMFQQALAEHAAGSLGIAAMLQRQLGGEIE